VTGVQTCALPIFDQGLLGLSAFLLLLLAVVVRMLAHADEWPMAPFFLASLAGFVAVGLFDSLVDVPRLAILYYLVCFALLVVSPAGFEARRRGRRGRA
jgi:ABC-type proline/glycine betaine transport system permease subunit